VRVPSALRIVVTSVARTRRAPREPAPRRPVEPQHLVVGDRDRGLVLARLGIGVDRLGAQRAAATGAPLLTGAAARFDCVASMVEAGSHTIVIGDVLAAETGSTPPLAYTGGDYAWVGDRPRGPAREIGRSP
jgi:Flavin reductase like domain